MFLVMILMMTLTTVPVNQACKPRMQRAVPDDSHDKNSETINTGLIAISRNSSDSGLDVTDVVVYCIAGILCLSVMKWLRKTCNRRLAAIQTGGATPTAPPQAAQPMPAVAQAQAPPAVAMPVNLPALPPPTYSVVYRAGHGREETASISEDVMQKFR